KTHIWLAYFPTPTAYQTWWASPPVTAFWSSLPPDAGMWREVISPGREYTQHGTNGTEPIGMGCLGESISVADKSGYWGCYRHRMAAGRGDRMRSEISGPGSGSGQVTRSPGEDGEGVRLGRVHMTAFPDNMCFVVEGQDHSAVTGKEKGVWFERFDGLVRTWIDDLVTAGPGEGVLGARICGVAGSGRFAGPEAPSASASEVDLDSQEAWEALDYKKKVQLFWFRDLGSMEKIGRRNAGHVKLRSSFLQAYGPGGELSEGGGIRLWVETSVLKRGEVECEYVGCWEGTGFMALQAEEGFR
ncbi:hypothetical protein BO70DRAFT_263695, partial [Aspergillus heteromorphus CBS 117.55]